jgi:hypothetical protein
MSFQCYTSRTSLRSASIGGLFISTDGTRRLVPDHWLTQAELLEGARLLRLSYTFCTIEIAGQCLDQIFEDASIGKLGAIQAAPTQAAPDGQLWVTSIVAISPPEPRVSAFEGEVSYA